MDGNFSTMGFTQEPLVAHAPPAGFATGYDGIYVETEGADGETTSDWLCSPLAVVARGRNADHMGWSRCIELVDPDGILHKWFVLEKDLTTGFGKVLAGLRDRGLNLAGGTSARRHLNDLIVRWEPSERYMTTDRLGWADASCSAYVLGDNRVIGNSNTVFLNEAVPDGEPAMSGQGTLGEWRDTVAAQCQGNSVLISSVSLAFAGPLLEMLDLETAGLHLRGGSSSGKTTAMGAAVSVWGSPKLMHSWRATANALEGVAATCNSSLLALDELGQVSGREVGDAVYTLANGKGKARSTSTGRLQPKRKWRLMLLSTGEISLADKMAEAGKSPKAGQEVRLIDIAADTRRHGVFDVLHGHSDSAIFANELKQATANSYGSAGPAFVEKLIGNTKLHRKLSNLIAKTASGWKAGLGNCNNGPMERVLGHFVVIAIAGEVATKFGITGWKMGSALEATFELAKEWREAQDSSEQWQVQAAVDRTRAYLLLNSVTHFEEVGGAPTINRAGYRDDKWFYVLGDAWNAIHSGHSPAEQARHLISGRWLVRGDGKNLKSKTPAGVPGRPRAYKIRADILDDASGGSPTVRHE